MLSSLAASPIEQKVRAATKDDGYKPSERLLAEIADATHSYKHLPIIMKVIWKRLNDHTRNWKKLYKALIVLEYIMKNGSEQVRIEVKVRRPEVLTLGMFQHGGTFDGKDIGLYVRDKAKEILEWLDANPPGTKKVAAPKSPSSTSSTPSAFSLSSTLTSAPTPKPLPVPQQGAPVPLHFQQQGPPQQFQVQQAPVPVQYAPPPQQYYQPPPQQHFQQVPPQYHPLPTPPSQQQYQYQQAPTQQQYQPQPFHQGGGFDPFATSEPDPFARLPPHQQQ